MQSSFDFLDLLADAESLQVLLVACPDGLVVLDEAENIVLYTGSSEAIFGFAPVELLGRHASLLFGDAQSYKHFQDRLRSEGRVVNLEVMATRLDSPPFAAAVSAASLRDRWGAAAGTVMYVRDHTKVRAIEEALRQNNRRLNDLVRTLNHVAQHDQLTGMLYRGSAIEAAEAAMLASGFSQSPFGVALFDLDHFKSVNDSYGHLVGDEVLATLSGVLRQAARGDDIVGRFGGEEFIAFLPGADLRAVTGFAERVRLAIGEACVRVAEDQTISVAVSAGVASIPTCAATLEDAIRIADDRLLSAKRQGRNRVVANDDAQEQTAA
ncbi:MAG: sensor domain-containing diguanylate cyclase [Dehalococcoidia bacterium]|nr:sensor domain-containing diguanylate cyclase [Dehalococcoidia bacterium]